MKKQSTTTSFMFNPTPQLKENKPSNKAKLLRKRQIKEKQKLARRAELIEYLSSDEEIQKKKSKIADDEDDYGALDQIDQDILGYFSIKGNKIVTQATNVLEPTFSIGTLVIGCVTEIGSNGRYVVVNLTRNRKGFISIDHFRSNQKISGGDFHLGEYIVAQVIENDKPKLQLSCLPSLLNEGRGLRDCPIGSLIVGIPESEDEYGYQINFGDGLKGFSQSELQLKVGRCYTFQVLAIEKKILICSLQDPKVYMQTHPQNPKWGFIPGTLWNCQIVKEVTGGLILKVQKLGVLGYVFADYCKKIKTSCIARVITFDHHLKNIQFSLVHGDLKEFSTSVKIGTTFNAVRFEKDLYGKSYLITPLKVEENDLEEIPQSKKKKKLNKLVSKGGEPIIIEEGPLSFLHSSQLWLTEVQDDETQIVPGLIVARPCRIKEINYFDHRAIATMKPSVLSRVQFTIDDLQVGSVIQGNVKNIIREDSNKIVVQLPGNQLGVVPGYLQGDNLKPIIGGKIKVRVLNVDQVKRSIILTTKLMTKQAITKYDELRHGQAIWGFVTRTSIKGAIIEFFGGITGFLSTKEIGEESELLQGQVLKVYVKYVNAKEKALQLSLREVEDPQDNQHVGAFRQQKNQIQQLVESLQFGTAEMLTEQTTLRLRKNQPHENSLLILQQKSNLYVLLKEQSNHSSDPTVQTLTLQNIISQKQVSCIQISNIAGVSLVSSKLNGRESSVVGSRVTGYVTDLTVRYALVNLPLVEGQPTAILYFGDKKVIPFSYMQTVAAIVKKVKDNKIHLELDKVQRPHLILNHFEPEKSICLNTLVGDIVNARVTMVKDYGVVAQLENQITGFIMNQNLLGGRQYQENDQLTVQILDIDYTKKIVDLRELNAPLSKNHNLTHLNIKNLQSGQVILVKDLYSVIKLKKVIGFLWHELGRPTPEYGATVSELKLLNPQHLKSGEGVSRIDHVPIFSSTSEEQVVQTDNNGALWKGKLSKATIISVKGAYVYVRLQNGKQGRIHKSLCQIEADQSKLFGYSSSQFDSFQKDEEIEVMIINVKHREGVESHFVECSLVGKTAEKMNGSYEKDLGKELYGVVKKINPKHPNVVSLEMLGGYQVQMNGWEGNIVNHTNGSQLNNLPAQIGDIVRVKLVNDYNNRLVAQNVQYNSPSVELYSVQIFRVVSHHDFYVRVQLPGNNYASIDITELQDEWTPGILDKFPVGHWGSCRLISQDVQFFGSARGDFLKESLWEKSLHPIKGSMLQFNKDIKPLPFDHRAIIYKNPAHQLELGSLVLGYITAVTDFGVFVKFGYLKDSIVLVPSLELSDETEYVPQRHTPALVQITRVKDGKYRGTMRYSLLIKKLISQPQVGEVLEGQVIEVKNQRAILKLIGYAIQGELDRKNAEGNDTEEGWFTEKLLQKGSTIKVLVLSVKELKGGDKVAKLTNMTDLIKEKEQPNKKPGKVDEKAVEVYNSLQALNQEYFVHQQKTQVIEQEPEDNQSDDEEQLRKNLDVPIEDEEMELDSDQQDQEDQENEDEGIEEEENQEAEVDPETLANRAEFEKEILSNPNSSELWVRFASNVMESEGIENARQIMERALRVINFNNEVEKLNLWNAYLNLEYHFGQEERLISIFKRGCQSCNPKQLHLKLINIYRKAENYDLMVELAKSMINKHKQSSKAWKELLQCLMEWHQHSKVKRKDLPAYSLKENLARAMQCLKKHKHLPLLAHYGRLQFQTGQLEQGRTTFDALLQQNPKRTDLLFQYVDLCARYCGAEVTRTIYERSLQNKLNPHKTKSIFKKWLEFESQYGNEMQVSNVQRKAQEWVEQYKKADMEIENDESD